MSVLITAAELPAIAVRSVGSMTAVFSATQWRHVTATVCALPLASVLAGRDSPHQTALSAKKAASVAIAVCSATRTQLAGDYDRSSVFLADGRFLVFFLLLDPSSFSLPPGLQIMAFQRILLQWPRRVQDERRVRLCLAMGSW